jgi:phosphatidylserine/phosphatidylglycerophosphate/cardiolipin synthase-like enzyme
MDEIKLLFDREIYTEFFLKYVPQTKKYLWIATANIKDLYVEYKSKYRTFLYLLSDLVKKGVEIRIIYAREPGENFRKDWDKYPLLWEGVEQMVCPRLHFKVIIVDGKVAYCGSANLTGAGIGAKSSVRRNFEIGFLLREAQLVNRISAQFDSLWIGNFCDKCQRKSFCGEYPFK